MADYQLTADCVRRSADGAVIPTDPANVDYAAFLEWQAAGNTPDPVPVVPAPIPQIVSLFQARAVMLRHPSPATPGKTLFDDVDAAVKALGGEAVQAWEYASEVHRNGTLLQSLAAALGLTNPGIDALFTEAAGISA